eukprot:15469961-Alexandrium_andersonii.AAC.1
MVTNDDNHSLPGGRGGARGGESKRCFGLPREATAPRTHTIGASGPPSPRTPQKVPPAHAFRG